MTPFIWLIFEDISWTLAEPVAGADIGEGGPGVGVPSEVLQVDDVRSPLPGGGQGGDAERMHGYGGIEAEGLDVAADQLFDRPGRHRRGGESVPAHAAQTQHSCYEWQSSEPNAGKWGR